ncbi:CFC_collapsed_G0057450.mRNA.1.CDS.1 [Saccharomyces cerevisiae]|nr:CFC_collapsed_G0057450.mRNA.1.CDS.1 [Saccharomyces cerevisiae]
MNPVDTADELQTLQRYYQLWICPSHPRKKIGQYLGDVDCKYALTKDHSTLICFYYPKDRQLNLALNAMDEDIDLTLRNKPNE